MERIAVIVPCFNEEDTINVYYNEVIKYLREPYDWRIIFVNDGSKDKTLELMRELAKRIVEFNIFRFLEILVRKLQCMLD